MSAPHESIWGSINTCFEIGLEVYKILGKGGDGIAIPTDKAKELLSEKALAQGTEKDGFIYFESPNKSMVAAYELIKNEKITDKEFVEEMGGLKSIEEDGPLIVPEYFGEFAFPAIHENESLEQIANGILLIYDDNTISLAIHKTLANYELSEIATLIGQTKDDDYLYYKDSVTASVPIFELSQTNETVKDYIISDESLRATLCNNIPTYVKIYNSEYAHDKPIENADAPTCMFLQKQLDLAAQQDNSYDAGLSQDTESEFELER